MTPSEKIPTRVNILFTQNYYTTNYYTIKVTHIFPFNHPPFQAAFGKRRGSVFIFACRDGNKGQLNS